MELTIKDIAKEAGVSVSTVSRAMNGTGYVSQETKDKIQALVKELDYVPSAMAKGLSKDINNIVGALIPEIDNPFFSGTLQGINQICDERDLSLMLCGTENKKRKELSFIHSLREQRVRGLLVASAATAENMDQEYISLYRDMNIPTVLFDRNIPGSNCDCVLFDDIQAIMELTNLLIDNQHRHIEILAGDNNMMTGQDRAKGFELACKMRGVAYETEWIHYCLFAKYDGYLITKEILSKDPSEWPTAIISGNNMLTLGALRAIRERGLTIPDDIALVGYDQLDVLEDLHFYLTLAEKNTLEMGHVAMNLLLSRMQQQKDYIPQKIVMQLKIVVRGSERFPTNRTKAHVEN